MQKILQTTLILVAVLLLCVPQVESRSDDTKDCSFYSNGVWTGQRCKSCGSCTSCSPTKKNPDCPATTSSAYPTCKSGCITSGTKAAICIECNPSMLENIGGLSSNGFKPYNRGLFKDNGICLPCPNDCLSCSSRGTCNVCNSPFYVYQGQCVQVSTAGIIANCASYAGEKKCSSCNPGFFLASETTCTACTDTNCAACSDAATCTACQNTHLLFNNKCTLVKPPPSTNCALFDTTDGTKATCSKCNTNYFPKGDNLNCVPDCETPDTANAGKCLTCADGYYLDTGVCKLCPLNAQKCSSATVVLQCADGYAQYTDTANNVVKCAAIPSNSSMNWGWCYAFDTQSNPTTVAQCAQCYDQYLLSAGNCISGCTALSAGCTSCSPGTIDSAATCTSCADGYFIKSGLCVRCDNVAASGVLSTKCDSNGVATGCMNGYYQKPGSTAVVCNACSDSSICAQCDPDQPHLCKVCRPGYFLDEGSISGTQNTCTKCQGACIECSDIFTCSKCYSYTNDPLKQNPGQQYFLDPNSNWCSNFGVFESDGVKVVSCSNGFYLEGGICKACYQNGSSQCPTTCTDTAPSTNSGNGTNANQANGILSVLLSLVLVLALSL